MSEKVNVQITATDTASPVFTKVASAADKLEKNLDNAERSAGRFSRTGAAIGAALGALSGIMADAARASAEAEVSQERLRTAIEATGDSYEMYADQLEAAGEAAVQMGFDDEEAADSIARLTTATGDAGEAIEQMGLIMDIARGRGISLAEATRIVEAVETGRMSTLRRLGIVIDETMSKEEALAELQRRYAGQAEAYSNTTAGFYDRIRNQLENVQESLGEHAGALQTVLVLLPGLSAGWTAAAAALGGLFNMLGGSNGALGTLGSLLTRIGGARAGIALGITAAVADGLIIAAGAGEDTAEIWDDFALRIPQLGTDINAMTAGAGDGMRQLGDDAIRAFTTITTTAQEVEDAWAEGEEPIQTQIDLLGNAEVAALESGEALQAFWAIMSHPGPGAAIAQQQLADLLAEFNDPKSQMNAVELFDGIIAINGSLDGLDESAAGAKASLDPMVRSLIAGAAAGAAANEAYAQLVATMREGMTQQFNEVTAAYTNTTAALSNGFRVIVGNTNAIAQQSQAVADWATELINVEGQLGKIDDLLQREIITKEEYTAAQEAYNSIAEDNLKIQDAILEIQTQQAPIMAQLMSEQAAYWDRLADAPADQQRLALAYQDTATAAQALAIAQAAADDAPGLRSLIDGAIRANPLLKDILVDMGLIKDNGGGSFTLLVEGKSELDILTDSIDRLVQQEWIAMFGGDITEAEAAYNVANGLAEDWDGSEAAATISADEEPAVSGFTAAQSYFNSWDGSTATATANVNDNASGVLSGLLTTLNGIDGYVATAYVNTIYTTTGAPTLLAEGLGGVAGYASGGVVARMGEWGTERMRFPNGGVAYTSGDGLYSVPRGTLVTPHTGRERPGGGVTINVNVAGDIYDTRSLASAVSKEIVPSIERAMTMHMRGF